MTADEVMPKPLARKYLIEKNMRLRWTILGGIGLIIFSQILGLIAIAVALIAGTILIVITERDTKFLQGDKAAGASLIPNFFGKKNEPVSEPVAPVVPPAPEVVVPAPARVKSRAVPVVDVVNEPVAKNDVPGIQIIINKKD